MRSALIALIAGAAAATPHAAPHGAAPVAGPAVNAAAATLPPFAADLAQMPMITGASG